MGTIVEGSTSGASIELDLPECGLTGTSPSVWYKLTGAGNTVTVSTCNQQTTYDTAIAVYTGFCGALSCEAENDDGADCDVSVTSSTVTWEAEFGIEYFILVHGFGGESGSFVITTSAEAIVVCPAYYLIQCGSVYFITTIVPHFYPSFCLLSRHRHLSQHL